MWLLWYQGSIVCMWIYGILLNYHCWDIMMHKMRKGIMSSIETITTFCCILPHIILNILSRLLCVYWKHQYCLNWQSICTLLWDLNHWQDVVTTREGGEETEESWGLSCQDEWVRMWPIIEGYHPQILYQLTAMRHLMKWTACVMLPLPCLRGN